MVKNQKTKASFHGGGICPWACTVQYIGNNLEKTIHSTAAKFAGSTKLVWLPVTYFLHMYHFIFASAYFTCLF